MTTTTTDLRCEMRHTCSDPVQMIDQKGYIYCHADGMSRRGGGTPCRLLTPAELATLEAGGTVAAY